MNRHLQIIGGIVFALIGFGFVFGAAYHWVMCGSQPTHDSLIETLNYSLQTITTVGYGNWVPAGWDISDTEIRNRILYVKAISVPFQPSVGSVGNPHHSSERAARVSLRCSMPG